MTPAPRHEVLVEVLRLISTVLVLISAILAVTGKFPKPWVYGLAFGIGILVLLWLAKPRVAVWFGERRMRERDQKFILAETTGLEKLVSQFKKFTSVSESRSLVVVLRSAFQNEEQVIQLYGSDYISVWLDCFRSELKYPPTSLMKFFSRYQQFTALVNEFNRNHVNPIHNRIEKSAAKLPERFVDQLEEFRDEFNPYLRSVEQWGTEILAYARFRFGDSAAWQHAPMLSFDRLRPFRGSTTAGA